MDPRDEWSAQEPPRDFADRVMTRIERGERANAPARGRVIRGSWRVAAAAASLGVAAGVALAVGAHYRHAAGHGDAIAAQRTQVALGARAVAVLESGAHVTWTGDDVQQPAGDVFYRVEPGGPFRVHTPAGDVQVLGTCFRVRVEDREEPVVNGRDIKAGAVGAALTAAALVSVYEGKVAVSNAKQSVTLTAGESARASGGGVRRASADGTPASPETSGGASALAEANDNLAEQVQDYKRRLDAIAAQKETTERELAIAQKKLALAESDGQAGPPKNPYDPSPDDLKQMAANGEVHSRMPCVATGDDKTTITAETLAGDGLPASEVGPINAAVAASSARMWGMLRPLCAQALGGKADLADALGVGACQSVVFETAKKSEDSEEEIRTVAEILAGQKPMPKDPSALGTIGQLVYQMSGASKTLERELAQQIGPDDARAFVYGEKGCWSNSSWSSGPRNPKPGTSVVTGATLPTP